MSWDLKLWKREETGPGIGPQASEGGSRSAHADTCSRRQQQSENKAGSSSTWARSPISQNCYQKAFIPSESGGKLEPLTRPSKDNNKQGCVQANAPGWQQQTAH